MLSSVGAYIRSLQACPVSVTLLYRVLINNNGIKSFSHSFDRMTENDPQTTHLC